MTTQGCSQSRQTPSNPALGPDTYTAQRLATPEHLYMTSRRCFIGPIPEGWLRSHRRDWYKHHLHINYSSRAATFSANPNVSRRRRITGLEGPSVSAAFSHSFPQPDDLLEEVEEEEEEEEGNGTAGGDAASRGEGGAQAVLDNPPAMAVPRASQPTEEVGESENRAQRHAPPDVDGVVEGSRPIEGWESEPEQGEPAAASRSQAKRPLQGHSSRGPSSRSFYTASEGSPKQDAPGPPAATKHPAGREDLAPETQQANGSAPSAETPTASFTESNAGGRQVMGSSQALGATDSTASLLRKQTSRADDEGQGASGDAPQRSQLAEAAPERYVGLDGAEDEPRREMPGASGLHALKRKVGDGAVHFNIPVDRRDGAEHAKMRMKQTNLRRASRTWRRNKARDGQIVKTEKMLVRVEQTQQQLTDDYDENDSQKTETRTIEKWREYLVVCRESADENAEFVVQMYTSRVIPEIEETHKKRRSKHTIALNRKSTKVNLYSSLDKTFVICHPYKKGTRIYIMQPRTAVNSVEWYTFLRNSLGWHRAAELHIYVPDLNVRIRLQDPFEQLETSQDLDRAAEGDDEAILRAMQEEQRIAKNIVGRCVDVLRKSPEWDEEVLDAWTRGKRIGLAWRRYDRLEWIHGANERKMYGTIALMKSHELELRPKEHYPTIVMDDKKERIEEPVPVEGFLVRLTSQKGTERRLGKLFYKRLYFSTHDQYLVYSKPAKATPPPPPKLPASENARIPVARQIAEKIPIIYAVNPYPVEGGEVTWLSSGGSGRAVAPEDQEHHDRDAYDEAERKASLILDSDGYVDLRNVVQVRKMRKGATPADEHVDSGSDVDFDESVRDTNREDGTTKQPDNERTFEIVLKNGLVIRLQAFDKMTRKEWMKRLRALVQYWTSRKSSDIQLFKSVRQRNLEELNIDEETEAHVGQFARKWEVTNTYASPELYNMCGISCCRAIRVSSVLLRVRFRTNTIQMSGTLYHKPRRHSTFTRCGVLLCHGRLLLFHDKLRRRSGSEVANIQNDRFSTLDLRDCYLYSGLLTENDLLYTNRTFDSNRPGHHALPRIYLEDGWTSTDEDVMTCFVVWHGRRRSIFRDTSGGESKRGKLKLVSSLGVPGRSIVFKTRSRAERDHWVLAIGMEIERLEQNEDVRFTGASSG
ncbi:Pleckstrin homology domain-containing protein [Lineolata rhizophorae]|uniref:Pleckstrin homology domain-containing protein n=1 Tax=Lineolata rhizophorae TaxID=578093 RepID=A0A6A6NXI8_9PEZI|nr:Pleckstrin homology domain-containing protein [Lineolata rhizophorae]